MNIYVGNLPFKVSEDDLRQLFESYGGVQSVNIITDRDTGRSKGFGFVVMPNTEEAQRAVDATNGQELGGRKLTVNEARPRESRPGGGGPRGY